jgi:hypothetical protein
VFSLVPGTKVPVAWSREVRGATADPDQVGTW